MDALVWRDYLCPWCWLGRDRSAVIEAMGVAVTHLPYDLHPEIPVDGLPVRVDGRLARVFDQIGVECAATGIEFRAPRRTPNTRFALETAEIVRQVAPECFAELDESLFRAHWVDALDLGDPGLVDHLVEQSGAPVTEITDLRNDGSGHQWVDQSMIRARSHGVTATPAWLIDGSFVIPGVQPTQSIQRWVGRLLERASEGS
ncbi:MAG: DsbA family protein [Actinomycetes bacterium]